MATYNVHRCELQNDILRVAIGQRSAKSAIRTRLQELPLMEDRRCQRCWTPLLNSSMNASVEPSQDRVAFILSRINAGLTQNWSQISELATRLKRMLKDARTLGESHIHAERREAWDNAWRDLRATFDAIRASEAEAHQRFTSANPSADPLEAWSDVLSREVEFNDSLAEIQTIAADSISDTERPIWKDLCDSIQRQIAMLESHAVAVRFQLELREKYGHEKADALTREIATRLPKDAGVADAKNYASEYRKAWRDFKHEQQTFGGVWDMLKALMLIQPKTPEQRMEDKQLPQRLQRPRL
jgi:hypothetical protein